MLPIHAVNASSQTQAAASDALIARLRQSVETLLARAAQAQQLLQAIESAEGEVARINQFRERQPLVVKLAEVLLLRPMKQVG